VPEGSSGPRREPSSFRDPAGFLYRREGQLLRQVAHGHAADWQHFLDSGLYARLIGQGRLIEHEPVGIEEAFDDAAWAVLRPRQLDFISYPYEWTFGQLKDAALLTLDAQAAALAAGMSLRDASAYNVQFEGSRPILIDALSFGRRPEGEPWIAYRQFCQHFLAPLALMALRDVRLGLLLREHVDGVPLDLATRLLPASSRLRLGLATHLHLHARAQSRSAEAKPDAGRRPQLSTARLEALIASLRSTIDGLRWQPAGTVWADYGETSSYSETAAASKRRLVAQLMADGGGRWAWDLGANTGAFSRLAAEKGYRVISLDGDPAAAERNYRQLKADGRTDVLPLVIDLANPSPALGWAHAERMSLVARANADVVIALALVHHLAIGNNVPLSRLSAFFARLGRQLVVEFVPKSDPRVTAMLAWREDVFADYTLDGFRSAFAPDWQLTDEQPIADSTRVLFRFDRRD
jgi:ribosomal protein L11 methylase PrmA